MLVMHAINFKLQWNFHKTSTSPLKKKQELCKHVQIFNIFDFVLDVKLYSCTVFKRK